MSARKGTKVFINFFDRTSRNHVGVIEEVVNADTKSVLYLVSTLKSGGNYIQYLKPKDIVLKS